MSSTTVETRDIGDIVRATATFRNIAGVATDPTGVTFKLRKPDGTTTTYVYPTDAQLVKDSTGNYHVDVTVTLAGFYEWRFEGTGTVTASVDGEFLGATSVFYPAAHPLASSALVTLKQAEVWLGRHGIQLEGETEDDIVLSLLINGASKAVQNEIRYLLPRETATAKIFSYDGNGMLSFAPYTLATHTSTVVHSDLPTASWWTLEGQTGTAEADYRLEPRQKNLLGTYDWMSIPKVQSNLVRHGEYQVTVTGDWGLANQAAVPGDIVWCVLEIVRLSYPETLAVRGPDLDIAAGLSLNWLPRQLLDLIDRYRPMV